MGSSAFNLRPGSSGGLVQTIFLGGPIQHALGHDGFQPRLRAALERLLEHMQAAGFRMLSAHAWERFGEIDVTGQSAAVVSRDMGWMTTCDLFACFLPQNPVTGQPVRTDGTCIELGWASALDKPIIIMRDPAVTHSHLIEGLGAVARVRYLDINEVLGDPGLLVAACRELLVAGTTSAGRSVAGG